MTNPNKDQQIGRTTDGPRMKRRAHILVIEDSLGVARALNRTLSLPQGGGHRVEICDSGEAALERLRSTHFDLLITDLRLPGMNGLAVLEHARQISSRTRSILITAFGSPQVEERARHLANAYLPKPFHLLDLVQVVQRILSEPAVHKQPFLGSDAARGRDVQRGHDATRRRATDMTTVVARRKASYLKVFACDLDGTLAEQGQIAPGTWEILRQAHSDTTNLVTILVTDRTLESYTAQEGYAASGVVAPCEAIVAENGAVVHFPRRNVTILPFGHLAPAVTQRLANLHIPLEHGKVIATTNKSHDETILEVLREVGNETTLEFSWDTVVVLPPGATKGAGLRYALQELGYSPRNVIACGDAENDHSLFEIAELAVATSNAPADVQAMADAVLPQPDGVGVQTLIASLLAGHIPDYMSRPSRRLSLGRRTSGAPVYLDPFTLVNGNLGMFGINGENEDWDKPRLAGLLAEELSRQGYQVCVIDPRSDYDALKTNRGTRTAIGAHGRPQDGPETRPPSVTDIVTFCESNQTNLVLDLSTYTAVERTACVQELLPAMRNLRARLGRPHWFLIEDVHSFCPPEGGPLTDLLLDSLQGGGFGLASGRPSQVAPALLEAVDYWLVTRLSRLEEITALRPFLTRYAGGPAALSQLSSLPAGQAYLCLGDVEQPSLSTRGFIKLRR